MFITAIFTIAQLWNQPERPSMDDWIKKMQFLYTMEYYTEEIISSAATWMESEAIILSKITQKQKIKYCLDTKQWAHMDIEREITDIGNFKRGKDREG